MDKLIGLILFISIVIIIVVLYGRKKKLLQKKLNQTFPEQWRDILLKKVAFYIQLNETDRNLFEKRVQLFLVTKQIEGVDTDIDDTIRLLVACSAIIPTFVFPQYNYPYVHSVLIYPGSFDEKYQNEQSGGAEKNIIGMVSGQHQNGAVILSKPDLIAAFDGLPHKSNVGVHEFVHMLDKEDGTVDGIPEILMQHRYVGPWLQEIKKEVGRIETGKSDINPYALTNSAEFLAVVSEYFFDTPEKFHRKHPELYEFLSTIYNKK